MYSFSSIKRSWRERRFEISDSDPPTTFAYQGSENCVTVVGVIGVTHLTTFLSIGFDGRLTLVLERLWSIVLEGLWSINLEGLWSMYLEGFLWVTFRRTFLGWDFIRVIFNGFVFCVKYFQVKLFRSVAMFLIDKNVLCFLDCLSVTVFHLKIRSKSDNL